jgi:hypothetical protein
MEEQTACIASGILRDYLPFINFSTDSALAQLKISIKKTPTSNSFRPAFYLDLDFSSGTGDASTANVPEFLTSTAYNQLDKTTTEFVKHFASTWLDYLATEYDSDFFRELWKSYPINLDDSQYFIFETNDNDTYVSVALPMSKEQLKMDAGNSEFSITVHGTVEGGANILPCPPVEKLIYLRSVNLAAVNQCALVGRFQKDRTLPVTTYKHGVIKITEYKRMIPTDVLSTDFWGSDLPLDCQQ